MYFADFWANFCNFLTIFFVLLPLLLEQFLDNKWLQYCEYEVFFVKSDKNGENLNLFFLTFRSFSFSVPETSFLAYNDLLIVLWII